jgi:hypothetical protein
VECKYESWCGAPLCPLESKVRDAFWYSGEEHCHREDLVLKYSWLGKQSKIARTKGCKDECFNVNMLEVLQQEDINKTLRGMDIDESNDKSWIRDYKLGNRKVKRIIKLEEKPRVGYVSKKGHTCLFLGKKCVLWRKKRDSYYVLDQDKKCIKSSKFLDVCENIVRDLEKIKTNKSIYPEKREYRKGDTVGESSKKISKSYKGSKIRGTKYKGENVDCKENGKVKVKHERKVKDKDIVKDQDSVGNARSHEALRNVR